jgi:ABC-2 type transport system permease protein
MAATLTIPDRAPAAAPRPGAARVRFAGIIYGEWLKISRQWTTWVMLWLLAGAICLPYLVSLARSSLTTTIQTQPLQSLYFDVAAALFVLRVFSGPLLIVIIARLIGMEYSSGAIRVLLARGVGRTQLLAAKLLAAGGVALAILAAGLALNALLIVLITGVETAGLRAFTALDAGFWQDTAVYVGTVAISMGVTILMAAAMTVVTRSLAAGLSAALSWFAADNLGLIFFFAGAALTKSDLWLKATTLLLGPNLNAMPGAVLLPRTGALEFSAINAPLAPVDGAHTLLVAALYALSFAAAAFLLTWRRDVHE